MADLLAIVSHHRGSALEPGAMQAFVATYESLRGTPASSEDNANEWAAVHVLDHVRPAGVGIEREAAGWTAWAGSPASPIAPGAALEQLDGQFALARLGADDVLTVATDPLGLKPLFAAEREGRTYVASSALVLAKHLRLQPSQAGLEAFLRTGNQIGRLTPWQGLARLCPGEAIAFAPTGRRSRTYWQPEVDGRIRGLPFAEAAAECDATAVAALASPYRAERPWLDLTGGFDTRLLALAASRGGVDFLANTSGDGEEEDTILAQRIAATAGWEWSRFGLPADWDEQLAQRAGAAVAWGDCHLDALPLAEVMFGHERKSEAGTLLLNGGGGEHFRDYAWGHELLRAGRSSTVSFERLIAWRVLGPVDLSALREDPTATVAAAVRGELEARVKPFSSKPNTFQDDLLYAFKATGHFGAYQAVAAASLHMELPFYSRAVFTAAISAAPRQRAYHRLMREMIFRLDPAIAAIQTETGGPAEPLRLANLHRFAPYPWRRGKRFAGRLRGRLAPSRPGPPSPRVAARGALVAGLRAEGRLDPGRMRSAALYDPSRLEALLARAAAEPAAVDWNGLGRIVTVELALEAVDAGLG